MAVWLSMYEGNEARPNNGVGVGLGDLGCGASGSDGKGKKGRAYL